MDREQMAQLKKAMEQRLKSAKFSESASISKMDRKVASAEYKTLSDVDFMLKQIFGDDYKRSN